MKKDREQFIAKVIKTTEEPKKPDFDKIGEVRGEGRLRELRKAQEGLNDRLRKFIADNKS